MKPLLQHERIQNLSRKIVRETASEHGGHLSAALHSTQSQISEGLSLGLRKEPHLRRYVRICGEADRTEPDWRRRPTIIRTLAAGHSAGRLLTELEYDLGMFEEQIYDE